jgi:hypothetical protein
MPVPRRIPHRLLRSGTSDPGMSYFGYLWEYI